MDNALGIEPRAAAAISRLVEKYSPSGTKIGWLMIASIFIEAWDLYSISFVIVFIKAIYHPSALMLGLASAATQGGALIGALIGGWLTDKIGRRAVFLGTMLMFFVFGVLQAFATGVTMLVIIRFIIGIPLGTDIANGYTYIMEFMQSGKREVMGNRWQVMFAVGEVVAIAIVLLFLGIGVKDALLWRIVLGLSGVPAIILFFLRLNLPETAIWLIQRGRYREAKAIASQMYGDPLEMLPDADVLSNAEVTRILARPSQGSSAVSGELVRVDRRFYAKRRVCYVRILSTSSICPRACDGNV
ncbi:hypothetical protein GCM10025858_32430 [Alicyclobacillus sacchari]|uniref:MFS transporter n=1 Tax=Alicyclobacillus sacchari TaxID=392010 RepID=UPI0023E9D96A|nr:MFS transporter [Alicyclobacillus sacchari]GMA58740.1 hypothetical protein GCM10025858_32430 [Alicyclobacillus sacchari]